MHERRARDEELRDVDGEVEREDRDRISSSRRGARSGTNVDGTSSGRGGMAEAESHQVATELLRAMTDRMILTNYHRR